ncbi:hypothetical protein F5144DRAFT_578868 [Chaetomium tenue]|uniref:Uncharacterized protein n=1 Tax=Chaetomium tenue TaxID=1854479 RepID=A0ACB7P3X9_9PEZI|nr:hypothetical protein F5144DRAFT_578868 [Chaetomium globosum]
MLQYQRTEFRCKHCHQQISLPRGHSVPAYNETNPNDANLKIYNHNCPRYVERAVPPPTYPSDAGGTTTGVSDMQASAPPLARVRPSARYAELVKLMVAARLAKQRAALCVAAGGKQPARAGIPLALMRFPAGAAWGGELVLCAVDRGWDFAILLAV